MIQIKNIVKNYLSGENEVHALKDVSINFRNSEFVSILGPSGCGKTTLLNIIGGLDKYTSGDIIINGVSTKEYKDKNWDAYRNHYIGFVFQSYNLISHLTILENVELSLSIAGLSASEKRKKAIKALKEVGLQDQMKKKPNQLSGGQMQRVAIARAIVNEPKIILADEPTGALDSETSIQVMDILKKVSEKYLVIMVTHNEILAERYSNRIISILDGKLIGDTNPYNPSEDEVSVDKDSHEKSDIKEQERKKKKKLKSAMSYFTAFMLSLKNLWSKKGKTIIESLAGSIGIIGIALVLAVSTGLNTYVANMQSSTLSAYPITIGAVAIDYDALTNYFSNRNTTHSEIDKETQLSTYSITNMLLNFGNFNFLNKEFNDYLDKYVNKDNSKPEDKKELTSFQRNYNLNMQVLTEYKGIVMPVFTKNQTSSMSGTTTGSSFSEGISNKDFILENYDVLGGETAHYPANKNEVALVVSKDNTIAMEVLASLGIDTPTPEDTDKATTMDISTIIGKEYRFLRANDYFKQTSTDPVEFEVENLSLEPSNMSNLRNIYNSYADDDHNDNKLRITCILRPKEDSVGELLRTNSIMYLPELGEYLRADAKASNIAIETLKLGLTDNFYLPYVLEISELSMFVSDPDAAASFFKYETAEQIINVTNTQYKLNLTKDDAIQMALQMVGASDIPTSVSFYTNSFDGKKNVINYINDWNKVEHDANNKIVYTDATGFLTETLGMLIDIISYVLIAFAAISLVVSSVMIGIITYSSVIERTKEIGVLRSIGARKKDISRIFNSETILIGFFAGLLGVLISWILTFPISAIIKAVAGGSITTSMAILKFSDAAVLVLISTILTTLAGTVPAMLASKKDPVKCLRTE